MSDHYEIDIALWSERQADALRRRASNEVDWENVAGLKSPAADDVTGKLDPVSLCDAGATG